MQLLALQQVRFSVCNSGFLIKLFSQSAYYKKTDQNPQEHIKHLFLWFHRSIIYLFVWLCNIKLPHTYYKQYITSFYANYMFYKTTIYIVLMLFEFTSVSINDFQTGFCKLTFKFLYGAIDNLFSVFKLLLAQQNFRVL